MRNIDQLLNRIKDRKGLTSDWQLAKLLAVSIQRLRGWRKGSLPDNAAAWKIAEQLQMQIGDVIGYIEEDRAKAKKDRVAARMWSNRLPRVLPSVAIASASLLALTGTLTGGAWSNAVNLTTSPAIHYAN